MIQYLVISFLAVSLGVWLANQTKKVTNKSHQKNISRLLNIIIIGLGLAIFALIRPELPKEGVFSVFHTRAELVEYEKLKVAREKITAIAESAKQYKAALE